MFPMGCNVAIQLDFKAAGVKDVTAMCEIP